MSIKIKQLEGIRTVGWIGIFICHFRACFMPGISLWTDKTPLRFIYSGNPYVRLFFVISGIVTSLKYWSNFDSKEICYDALKRYFRLMPSVLFAEISVYCMTRLNLLQNQRVAVLFGEGSFLGQFNRFEPNLFSCFKEALLLTWLFDGNATYIAPLWSLVYEFLGVLLVLAVLAVLVQWGGIGDTYSIYFF